MDTEKPAGLYALRVLYFEVRICGGKGLLQFVMDTGGQKGKSRNVRLLPLEGAPRQR